MDEDAQALQEQIAAHTKRLRILEERAAIQGINTPPEIVLEIEQIRDTVRRLSLSARQHVDDTPSVEVASPQLKYYLYASDAKLDMLYPQIPQGMRDKIARELNIDPPILSSVLSESDSLGKLQVVVNYLERQQAFGTVDSPQTYVKGVMPLRWGMFSDKADRIGGKSLGMYDTVYFVGQTARTTVLLGGSSKHLLGMESEAATATATMSSSNILRIAVMLAKELRERGELDGIADTPHAPSADLLERGAQTMMRELPEQQLEFLAKRLIYYPRPASEGRNVLLGTPLYVALAE